MSNDEVGTSWAYVEVSIRPLYAQIANTVCSLKLEYSYLWNAFEKSFPGQPSMLRMCLLSQSSTASHESGHGHVIAIPLFKDYWATKWPKDLHIADGSVAKELDRLNDQG